jgi:hypothetical protein
LSLKELVLMIMTNNTNVGQCAEYWSSRVQQEYKEANNGDEVTVQINDVGNPLALAFALAVVSPLRHSLANYRLSHARTFLSFKSLRCMAWLWCC